MKFQAKIIGVLIDYKKKSHVTYQIHNNWLMYLLPEMCSEDLNIANLQGGDFTMHKNAGEIQLHLKPHVNIGSVDSWWPP